MLLLLLLASGLVADEWQEFRSGPFTILSSAGEKPAREVLNELEQILAPIALYPDALLAQIFMASTYPLEVVEAARWSKS